MRLFLVNVVLLAAMLTIGKFSTDAGYIVNLVVLGIGAIIGAVMFVRQERRDRKHNAE